MCLNTMPTRNGSQMRQLVLILTVTMLLGTPHGWSQSSPGIEGHHIADPSRIESASGQLTVSALPVDKQTTATGTMVEIRLADEHQQDAIRLNIEQIDVLLKEIEHLSQFRSVAARCDNDQVCMFGVARCRPSQTEPQLLCPGYYSNRSGVIGVILATSKGGFRFPGLSTNDLHRVLDHARTIATTSSPSSL